jgi:hypothetical protein
MCPSVIPVKWPHSHVIARKNDVRDEVMVLASNMNAVLSQLLEGPIAQKIMLAVASTENNFRASQSISAMAEPEDLELYRNLLPNQLDMPQRPLVWVSIVDNMEVGPWPLTPYQLGFISLYCAYQGEEGFHPVTMPENKRVPIWAGRTMGYPKYFADRITLEHIGDGWRGEVMRKGVSRLLLEFSPEKTESPAWVKEGQHPELGPTFNLNPPRIGPRVQVVRTIVPEGTEPSREVLEGTIVVTIGSTEAGAGLLKPRTPLYGTYIKARNADASLQPE